MWGGFGRGRKNRKSQNRAEKFRKNAFGDSKTAKHRQVFLNATGKTGQATAKTLFQACLRGGIGIIFTNRQKTDFGLRPVQKARKGRFRAVGRKRCFLRKGVGTAGIRKKHSGRRFERNRQVFGKNTCFGLKNSVKLTKK